MDRQIRKRLTVSVKHHPATGKNGYSDVTFGDPIDRMCYVEGKIEAIRTESGKDVTSMQRLYFDGQIPVTPDDDIEFGDMRRYQVLAHQYYPSPFDSGKTVVFL